MTDDQTGLVSRITRKLSTIRLLARRAAPVVLALLVVTSTIGGLALVGTQPTAESQHHGTAQATAADGSVVYTSSDDNTVKALDAETNAEIWTFSGHSDKVTTVEVSPDGSKVYTGSWDNTVKALDAETGEVIWTFGNFSDSVLGVSPSPDGSKVFTAAYDGTVKAVDAETGEELWTFSGHSVGVQDVSTSPDGSKVYSAGYFDAMAIDAETGEQIWVNENHSNTIQSISAAPDGSAVFTGAGSNLRALDPDTGKTRWTYSQFSDGVEGVASSPDSTTVYGGSVDDTLRAINATTGDEIWTSTVHTGTVFSVSPTPDGEKLITGSYDQGARAIDAGTGDQIWNFTGHSGQVLDTSGGYIYEAPSVTLNGTITDPSGDGYSGATVELQNDTAVVARTTTQSNGSFSISEVSDGDYTLRVSSDEFDTVRRSINVSGSSVAVNVQLGYRQTVILKDPRGIFRPHDPKVTVYRWEGSQLATRSPGGPDWTRTQTRSISWDGDVQLGLADGEFYAFVLSVDHSEAAGGSAEATIFGFVGNSSNGAVTWDVSEPESASNSTVVAETSGNTARVVYDGPPVEELDYSVEGEGNSTLERNMSFDEPRSYYETQVRLNSSGTNLSEPESLSYSGVYANGSTFNGSASISPGNFSSFGPVGGGGGGPSGPLGPVIATTTLAGAGLLLYSRRSGQSLGELAGGAARSLGSVLGRRGR